MRMPTTTVESWPFSVYHPALDRQSAHTLSGSISLAWLGYSALSVIVPVPAQFAGDPVSRLRVEASTQGLNFPFKPSQSNMSDSTLSSPLPLGGTFPSLGNQWISSLPTKPPMHSSIVKSPRMSNFILPLPLISPACEGSNQVIIQFIVFIFVLLNSCLNFRNASTRVQIGHVSRLMNPSIRTHTSLPPPNRSVTPHYLTLASHPESPPTPRPSFHYLRLVPKPSPLTLPSTSQYVFADLIHLRSSGSTTTHAPHFSSTERCPFRSSPCHH